MDTDARLGTEFAGYRIESVLGRGGMGIVYLATDTRLGRQVALKLLSPELSNDQRFRDRFIQESRMAAGLEHHGIVPVHEAGEHEGQLYIAMRHISGDDLASVIERDGPLLLDRTASIVEQVADALDTAHERGLIHRDVKPANILVETGRRDRAYLTDFGVTKRTSSRSGLTQTGQFMGTVDYVAPEQIEGKDVDGRADQYSLGCVAYECLTGEPPFAKDSEVATIYAHLKEVPPRPSVKRPDLPPAIDGVVARAMAKRPEDRYPSCGALSESVSQAVASAPVAGVKAPSSQGRVIAMAAAGVLVAAVVAAGVTLATRSEKRNPGSNGPGSTPALGQPPGLARIDPSSNRVVKAFDFYAGAVTVSDDAVWALLSGEVVKVNPQTNTVVAHITIPPRTGGSFTINQTSLAVGEGGVWVSAPPSLVRIDPGRNEVTANVPGRTLTCSTCPAGPLDPNGVAAGLGAVWVLNPSEGIVAKIDPETNKRLAAISIPNSTGIAVGEGAVWVTNTITDVVFRIDPVRARVVKRIPVPGAANGIAVGSGSVWVSNSTNGTVIELDPDTNRGVDTISVGRGPRGLAVGAGAVWVANSVDGTVSRIDLATRSVVATIPIGLCARGGPEGVAAQDDAVWVISKCR